MKLRLACVISAVLIAAIPASAADDPDRYDDIKLKDRFLIELGVFFTDFQTRVEKSGNILGTIIFLEDDVGLESNQTNFRVDGHWRLSNKNAIQYGLLLLGRDSERVIEKGIVIDPGEGNEIIEFELGGSLRSNLDTDIFKVIYQRSFINKKRVEVGIQAGLSVFGIDYGLRGEGMIRVPSTGDEESGEVEYGKSITVPVPVLGFFFSYQIKKNWFLRVNNQAFKFEVSDLEGSLRDNRFASDYYFHRNVGIGVGFNSVELEYTDSTKGDRLDIKYEYEGFYAYVGIRF